jgi:hypothetical protein
MIFIRFLLLLILKETVKTVVYGIYIDIKRFVKRTVRRVVWKLKRSPQTP